MPQTRQLAAIMFTDIVGYTALMGEDEEAAFDLLNKNRVLQQPLVEKYGGKLLKEIGDGTLASFSSASDAVYCALELQKDSLVHLDLSLRIGVHLGDVVFQNNDVFGDGVNIASRIQELAPPTGILVSESVFKNVSNKKGIDCRFFKEVRLKNVKDPVKVYQVIAVNSDGAILETFTTKPPVSESIERVPKSKRKLFLTLTSFVLAILTGWLFWKTLSTTNSTISKSVKESRIAVLPFENKTNDPELDVLSDMAADWIIKGLMNFEDLKIVSYQNVKDHFEYATLGNWETFANQTGAENIIKGSFYQQGEKLIFQSQIINGSSGDIEFVLPEISGSRSNTGKIVDDLKQRIMTLFTDVESEASFTTYINKNPPVYGAYKYYMESNDYYGVDYPKAREYLSKAIGLDSTFFWHISKVYLATVMKGILRKQIQYST